MAVPAGLRAGVRAVLEALRRAPAVTVACLRERLSGEDGVGEALAWMEETGLVLRTRPVDGWIDPATVDASLGESVFAMHPVRLAATDFVVFE